MNKSKLHKPIPIVPYLQLCSVFVKWTGSVYGSIKDCNQVKIVPKTVAGVSRLRL